MEIRGERECQDCGTQWSYYETGSVTCPDCGSLRSTGLEDERRLHTDAPVEFDLTDVRTLVGDVTDEELATEAAETAREYVRRRGFVDGGELGRLDDTYLAAAELAAVGELLSRALSTTDDEELYFLRLLRGADRGERPDPADVPASLRSARGLADADAVEEYRRDATQWIETEDGVSDDPQGEPNGTHVRETATLLGEHVKRIRALQGDVPPGDAERLVAAARDFGAYLRGERPDGLTTCRDRLDRLVGG